MNNRWCVCHLPLASKYLLRKMIHKAYCTLNRDLTREEQVDEMNILGGLTKDELVAKGKQMLGLLERRRMCCLDFPEVPRFPDVWRSSRKRRRA